MRKRLISRFRTRSVPNFREGRFDTESSLHVPSARCMRASSEDLEESRSLHFWWDFQIFGEGADSTFVDFEEQSVLTSEVLED